MKAKVVLIGDGGVGKTSLIRRFVLDAYEDRYLRTVGTKVSKIQLEVPLEDVRVEMDIVIFDIMGQREFRDMVKETYFHGVQGYLAVCDVSRRESLTTLHDWIAAAMEQAGNVPGYIIVNKPDLPEKQRSITKDEVDTAARIFDASVAYTSAKTGAGVDVAFSSLAVQIAGGAFRETRITGSQDFRHRLLALVAKRGRLGANKEMIFKGFPGLKYADLERELQSLEAAALVRVAWRGPGEFTVLITEVGPRALDGR